jgi:hypothetical protein
MTALSASCALLIIDMQKGMEAAGPFINHDVGIL